MKPTVTPEQQEKILSEVAARYGTQKDQLTPVGGGTTNHVYSYSREGKSYIVRWTPGDEQVESRIEAEVDWLSHLHRSRAPVVQVIRSLHNRLVEIIRLDDVITYVVAFEKNEGQLCSHLPYTPELALKAGRALGKIHQLTQRHYNPNRFTRPDWQTWYQSIDNAIPASQTVVLDKWRRMNEYFDTLPQEAYTYGLVHGDYQQINWFLADNEIVVIDFDDSHYNWLIYDVATMLYFALWASHPGQTNQEFADDILKHILEGYRQENDLDTFWVEQIPAFLKSIELSVYAVTHQTFGLDKGADFSSIPLRFQKALARYRQNIENDVPYIESAHFPWADDV